MRIHSPEILQTIFILFTRFTRRKNTLLQIKSSLLRMTFIGTWPTQVGVQCFNDLLEAVAQGLGGQDEEVLDDCQGSHLALLISTPTTLEFLQQACVSIIQSTHSNCPTIIQPQILYLRYNTLSSLSQSINQISKIHYQLNRIPVYQCFYKTQ